VNDRDKTQIEALTPLAKIGARRAAEAFSQLVGDRVEALSPILSERGPSARISDPRATGVFFELEGCLDAIVGIVFPGRASEALARRICGIESGDLDAPAVESAVMEVGNILVSHVASAIADELGERLLPSIPSLAMADAQAELECFLERVVGPDASRIEIGLANGQGTLSGYLVLVPTR
jgi:chemotaxis protein CheY-P-specific phosphatase CheC